MITISITYMFEFVVDMDKHTQRKRFSVRDVLSIIDEDNSDFGSYSESESDYESSDNHISAEETASDDNAAAADDDSANNDAPDPPQLTHTNDTFTWRTARFDPPNTTFTGKTADTITTLVSPLEYFKRFISSDMIDELVEMTNQYSIQKSGDNISVTSKEIEQVLGMYFHMGIVRMSNVQMYWEQETRYPPVAQDMCRDRFMKILSNIHFVDNLRDHSQTDKLWKIRPWLVKFRRNCLIPAPEEDNSIDEMMVPFKGKFSGIKQYIKGKPNPWGLKIWARTTTSGFLCDFSVYQGQGHVDDDGQVDNKLGIGANVVLNLCKTLSPGQHYKVYSDNYFTSPALIIALQKLGIDYVGTVRSNRMKGCILKSDKELAKEGRGAFNYQVERNNNIIAIKWMDTKPVTVLSNFTGVTPLDNVQRWSKQEKGYVSVPRPHALSLYNENMGGVNQLHMTMTMTMK